MYFEADTPETAERMLRIYIAFHGSVGQHRHTPYALQPIIRVCNSLVALSFHVYS